MSLIVSTVCVFGLAKAFDKLAGVKIPCRELLFVFLTLFPAPGAAVTQALADQSSIQVVVHTNTNINASTSMVAVDAVASWKQLVTACAAPSANITLSPAFQMGAYTNQIDFRLVLTYGSLISKCCAESTRLDLPCLLAHSACLPACLSVSPTHSGKVIIIFGSNATLDAGQKGSFFRGDGSRGKTSLELHDTTLKNGQAQDVRLIVSFQLHYFPALSEHHSGKKITNSNFRSMFGRGGHMQRSLNERRSVNSARIAMKLGAGGTSGC
jgi:hypothetical protein